MLAILVLGLVLAASLFMNSAIHVRVVADEGSNCQPKQEEEPPNVWLEEKAFGETDKEPTISPNICINAQPKYKTAKFTAHVEPLGCSGRLSVNSGDVTVSPLVVRDGGEVTVQAKDGATIGTYEIKITHETDITVSATGGGVIFEISNKKLDPEKQNAGETGIGNETDEGNGADRAGGKGKDYRNANTLGYCDAETATGNQNDLNKTYGANLHSEYEFIIATNPENVYSGLVLCNGTVSQASDGVLWGQLQPQCITLMVVDQSLLSTKGIQIAWEFSVPGVPVKINASQEWVSNKTVVAGFNQGIGVQTPEMKKAKYAPDLQVVISTSDIPHFENSFSTRINSAPSITWSNEKFKANDATSKGLAEHDMLVSAMRGVSDWYYSFAAIANEQLINEILTIKTENYRLSK
jgi:hypothetical protein